MESGAEFDLLKTLLLEEPGGISDQKIRAYAHNRLKRTRLARVAAAAAILLLAPALFFFNNIQMVSEGASRIRSETDARLAIDGLRGDLEEIHEMVDLIQPERQADRHAILAKVRACLLDLDRLDKQLSDRSDSSLLPMDLKKEENV